MWTQYDATKLKPPVKYSCQKKKKSNLKASILEFTNLKEQKNMLNDTAGVLSARSRMTEIP